MTNRTLTIFVAALLAAGSGFVWAQPAYKCKNAAGIVEYSDKPCSPANEEMAWRPKYSATAVTKAEGSRDKSDKAGDGKAGEGTAPHRAPPRKSAYTRYLDAKEEAAAAAAAQKAAAPQK